MIIKILLPVAVLVFGIAATTTLIVGQEELDEQIQIPDAPIVEVVSVERQDFQVSLNGYGALKAREIVDISAQVSGRTLYQYQGLEAGSRIPSGALLFSVDPSDYQINLDLAAADLNKAKEAFRLEQGRQAIAQREWSFLDEETRNLVEDPNLALRGPQLESARAEIAVTQSTVDLASLNIERTKVYSPCDGVVLEEKVAIGNLINAADVVVTLACSEYYSVETALPISQVEYLDLPQQGESKNGIMVRSGKTERSAIVTALLPSVEPGVQMARLLVHVKDPLGDPPLLLGAHVEVDIPGKRLADVFVLPSKALRSGDKLWVLSANSTLEVRRVEPVLINDGSIVFDQGLEEGDHVITSSLALPVDGMALKASRP